MIYPLITAFLSGAAVLVIEMTATRSLAPFFGQANFVWTNVIGLVLLGLAVGSLLGGRFADRHPRPGLLAMLLVASAALIALSGFLPATVARAILPDNLPLEASYEFLLKGSFVTTLVCFVPPVILLGAVPPFLVRTTARRVEAIGACSGQLYGASTLGSILGTFLTTYWLLPGLGTRGSLLLAAGLLLLSAIPLLLPVRRSHAAGTGVLAAVALGLSLTPSLQAPVKGMALGEPVAVKDSAYQHIEVLDRPDLPGRVIALDEGHDSYQSLLPPEGVLTGGYYDYFNVLAASARDGEHLSVLILGYAGGTHARQLLHFFGHLADLRIVGVELDPVVLELSREYLDAPDDPRVSVVTNMDARAYLTHAREQFHLIVVDCYSAQSYIPAHLASREFFESARAHLTADGLVAANLYGYGGDDPVIRAVSETMAAALGGSMVLARIPNAANFLAYGNRGGDAPLPRDLSLAADVPAALQPLLTDLQPLARSWRVQDVGTPVLLDTSGSLDRLQETRLRERARRVLGVDVP